MLRLQEQRCTDPPVLARTAPSVSQAVVRDSQRSRGPGRDNLLTAQREWSLKRNQEVPECRMGRREEAFFPEQEPNFPPCLQMLYL